MEAIKYTKLTHVDISSEPRSTNIRTLEELETFSAEKFMNVWYNLEKYKYSYMLDNNFALIIHDYKRTKESALMLNIMNDYNGTKDNATVWKISFHLMIFPITYWNKKVMAEIYLLEGLYKSENFEECSQHKYNINCMNRDTLYKRIKIMILEEAYREGLKYSS